jgi:hypothetical protein
MGQAIFTSQILSNLAPFWPHDAIIRQEVSEQQGKELALPRPSPPIFCTGFYMRN